MNKKAQVLQRGLMIASLVLTLFMGIFFFIFIDQSTEQFLIEPLDNVSKQIFADQGITGGYNDTLGELKNAYEVRPFSYDLFFLTLLLIAFVTTSYSAVQANKFGYFTLFGYIFILSLFFMVIIFFINQFTDYLIESFMLPLFSDTTLDIPIMLHFFNNLSIYCLLWFLWLGLLGFIDFKEVVTRGLDRAESLGRGGFER